MKKITLLFILLVGSSLCAQTEDAWVYFTDKENVDASIANPITILTQQAIDRKNLHGVAIDERDVPVNENYISQLKSATGITVLAKSKWFNCVYVRGTESNIRALTSLAFVANLDFADDALNTRRGVSRPIPDDYEPRLNKFEERRNPEDFDYGSATAQIQQLNADYLHQQGFSGQDMIIAVMDSGFPGVNTIGGFERARNEGRLLDGYDFVDRNDDEFAFTGSSHGTSTFSDIAGYIEGSFVGTAPDAKYYLFRTEDVSEEGPKEESLWVEAAERADSLGVHVINTSLGYSDGFTNPNYNYTPADMDGKTAFISKGADLAFEKGMMVVNSAGNSGSSAWGIITAPADAEGAFTIGSVTSTGSVSGFSSRGPTADGRVKPDVMARGSGAAVIRPNNTVGSSNGTSFSSPIMAGAVACLWQAFPSKTNAEIMQLIRESGSTFSNPTNDMGYGIPDFQSIFQTLDISDKNVEAFSVYPSPADEQLFIDFPTNDLIVAKVFSLDGKQMFATSLTDQKYISVAALTRGLYILEIETKNSRHQLKIAKK